jgi:Ca2+-binding RTX toxin-like protein
LLIGEAGADTLSGGNDTDYLFGGADKDVLLGGAGNDFVYGGYGNDILTGGTGADVFYFGSLLEGVDVIKDFQRANLLVRLFQTTGQFLLTDQTKSMNLVLKEQKITNNKKRINF